MKKAVGLGVAGAVMVLIAAIASVAWMTRPGTPVDLPLVDDARELDRPRIVNANLDEAWKLDKEADFVFYNQRLGLRFGMHEDVDEVLKRLGHPIKVIRWDPREPEAYAKHRPSWKYQIDYQYYYDGIMLDISELGPLTDEERVGNCIRKIGWVYLIGKSGWETARGVKIGDHLDKAIARYRYTQYLRLDTHTRALDHWPVIEAVIKPLVYPFLTDADLGRELWHLNNVIRCFEYRGFPDDDQYELTVYADYETGEIIGVRALR